MRHTLRVLAMSWLVIGCGSDPTPAGETILHADVQADHAEGTRARMVGSVRSDPLPVAFPDGEGSLEVDVVSARDGAEGEPAFMRSIDVRVVDAGDYRMSAELIGEPTNAGTGDAPVHARVVQITRTRAGLTGTSTSQMTVRVQPGSVERI